MQQGQNIKLACWIAEVLRKHRGMTRKLFANPLHPYTIGLFNSLDQWVARLHGFVLHVKRLLVRGSLEISFEQTVKRA